MEEDLYGVEDEEGFYEVEDEMSTPDKPNQQLHTLLLLLLLYYIFSLLDMFAFLHAQLNWYCFLFKHIHAWTGKTYSLPKFTIMVLALRALRFSYRLGILAAELLL